MDVQGLIAAVRGMDVEGMPAGERRLEAAKWLHDALMEHASIASFARFSMQLLAVGAPPDLLARCHRAALDEVDHARLSFAVASRLGGAPVGPGPLPMNGDVLGAMDLASITRSAVLEGCIGESLAAWVAERSRRAATSAPIAAIHARIAVDEATHADLAFAFVRWAVAREPSLAGEVEALCAAHLGARAPELDAAWPALLDGSRTMGSVLGGA